MRKSYPVLLSLICSALVVSAPLPAAAYVYLYHPGVAAVQVDPSVLDDDAQPAAQVASGWLPEGYPSAPQQDQETPPQTEAPQQNNNAPNNEQAPPVAPKPVASELPTEIMPLPVETETPARTVVPKPAPPPVKEVEVKPLLAKPLPEAEDEMPVVSKTPDNSHASDNTSLTPEEMEPVVPKAAAAKAPEEITAQPAPQKTDEGTTPAVPSLSDLSLNFDTTSSTLSPQLQLKLDGLVSQIKDADMRLQIRGFAKGDATDQSSARRMALARALAVRSYLMDKGIKPVRLDVRALGSETDQTPIDRVDLVFVR